jgi:hypothetical protein
LYIPTEVSPLEQLQPFNSRDPLLYLVVLRSK